MVTVVICAPSFSHCGAGIQALDCRQFANEPAAGEGGGSLDCGHYLSGCTATATSPKSGGASILNGAWLRSMMRPSCTSSLAGPRSVIVTTTLRRGCESEASVTRTLVPSGKNQEAAVNLSGLNRLPLAISLPRCSSPYHEATPLVPPALARAIPRPVMDRTTQTASVRQRSRL